MARMVNCVKLKTEAEGLDFPPYPGALGKQLYEGVSKQAWQEARTLTFELLKQDPSNPDHLSILVIDTNSMTSNSSE